MHCSLALKTFCVSELQNEPQVIIYRIRRIIIFDYIEMSHAESDQAQSYINKSNEDNYFTYKQLIKDLQFIQLLADPQYILNLYNRGYFHDEQFIDYLNKLNYLLSEQYITMIKYPEGIYNFRKIQSQSFINSLRDHNNKAQFIQQTIKRNTRIQQDFK